MQLPYFLGVVLLTDNIALEDMRGRYMAVFGLTWGFPAIFGPRLVGLILDNMNPNLP